jgi:hypothetical protein
MTDSSLPYRLFYYSLITNLYPLLSPSSLEFR